LENKYSAERLNLACHRALEYRAYSYKSVVNILQKELDKQTTLTPVKLSLLITRTSEVPNTIPKERNNKTMYTQTITKCRK